MTSMLRWPHAPNHSASPPGAYFITAGTYLKQRFLDTPEKLDLHLELLFNCAEEFGWSLQAWAVLSNHYHIVAHNEQSNLVEFVSKLHTCSSRVLNKIDGQAGRKCWFQYREKHLTYERSYLARLNYTHNNPVKHGLVRDARQYPWCSAQWFFQGAERPFYETVSSFKTDQLNEDDDFD